MAIFSIEITGVGDSVSLNERSLRAFRYEESTDGVAKYLIHARVPDDQAWLPILLDPEKEFGLRIRFQGADSTVTQLKQLRHGLSSLISPGDAPEIKLRGFCKGGELLHDWAPSLYYKRMPVSDMVKAIAERVGLRPDVVATKGTWTRYQAMYRSGAFIKHFLLPLAYNANRADYQFWVRDGKYLVFKPPEIGSPKATFVVPPTTEQGDARVERHEFTLDDDAMALNNSLSVVARGWDPLRRQLVANVIDESQLKYPKLAQTAPDPPVNPTTAIIVPHVGPPDYDPQRPIDLGKAAVSRHMRSGYGVTLAFSGSLDLKPADTINIDSDHPLGGRYLIRSITHNWDERAPKMVTMVDAERRTHQ